MKSSIVLAGFIWAFISAAYAADWLTEDFYSFNFDLNGVAVTFTPQGDTNYTVSAETITELPVNVDDYPGDSIYLDFETLVAYREESYSVALSVLGGSYKIPYFVGIEGGGYFENLYISPNGFMHFSELTPYPWDYSPSLSEHFAHFPLSLLFGMISFHGGAVMSVLPLRGIRRVMWLPTRTCLTTSTRT